MHRRIGSVLSDSDNHVRTAPSVPGDIFTLPESFAQPAPLCTSACTPSPTAVEVPRIQRPVSTKVRYEHHYMRIFRSTDRHKLSYSTSKVVRIYVDWRCVDNLGLHISGAICLTSSVNHKQCWYLNRAKNSEGGTLGMPNVVLFKERTVGSPSRSPTS